MPQRRWQSLRDVVAGHPPGCILSATNASVPLDRLAQGSSLGGALAALAGRSVLVAAPDQLTTALTLIELDGVARRLVLCPPDLAAEQVAHVAANAEADAVVCAPGDTRFADLPLAVACSPAIAPAEVSASGGRPTEWIMLTSGTSGAPKMVVHTLATLTGAIAPDRGRGPPAVWGTFYDIRRYGGLQILLRAILGGAPLVLSSAGESMADYLERLGARGVTHLSGTPSHWRWALLSPSARAIAPRYVRLSGEIADQAILDHLREFFPHAALGHAFASTEAGVAFEVNDGREGFPSRLIAATAGGARMAGGVEMKVADGSLRIRSNRTALRYLGGDAPSLRDADGFVDTGDILELRGERCHFVGRRGGIINVGGLKVHPEEIEAVINRHPEVRMSLVRARRNPVIGAIVVADVMLRVQGGGGDRAAALKREILDACRGSLPQHKVPAAIRFVPALDVSAAGKMARRDA